VLRNPSRPRRYVLASRIRPVATEEEMLSLVERDPSGPIPILAPAGAALPPPAEDAAGGVEVIEYRPGSVRLRVDARAATTLLVRESWSPGWSATVDGARALLHPAAGLFFVVPLDAGRHTVELRYAAPGLAMGMAGVTALILVACIGSVWHRRGRSGRSRGGS
jgi:hypothetical protein